METVPLYARAEAIYRQAALLEFVDRLEAAGAYHPAYHLTVDGEPDRMATVYPKVRSAYATWVLSARAAAEDEDAGRREDAMHEGAVERYREEEPLPPGEQVADQADGASAEASTDDDEDLEDRN